MESEVGHEGVSFWRPLGKAVWTDLVVREGKVLWEEAVFNFGHSG